MIPVYLLVKSRQWNSLRSWYAMSLLLGSRKLDYWYYRLELHYLSCDSWISHVEWFEARTNRCSVFLTLKERSDSCYHHLYFVVVPCYIPHFVWCRTCGTERNVTFSYWGLNAMLRVERRVWTIVEIVSLVPICHRQKRKSMSRKRPYLAFTYDRCPKHDLVEASDLRTTWLFRIRTFTRVKVSAWRHIHSQHGTRCDESQNVSWILNEEPNAVHNETRDARRERLIDHHIIIIHDERYCK